MAKKTLAQHKKDIERWGGPVGRAKLSDAMDRVGNEVLAYAPDPPPTRTPDAEKRNRGIRRIDIGTGYTCLVKPADKQDVNYRDNSNDVSRVKPNGGGWRLSLSANA